MKHFKNLDDFKLYKARNRRKSIQDAAIRAIDEFLAAGGKKSKIKGLVASVHFDTESLIHSCIIRFSGRFNNPDKTIYATESELYENNPEFRDCINAVIATNTKKNRQLVSNCLAEIVHSKIKSCPISQEINDEQFYSVLKSDACFKFINFKSGACGGVHETNRGEEGSGTLAVYCKGVYKMIDLSKRQREIIFRIHEIEKLLNI